MAEICLLSTDLTPASPETSHLAEQFIAPLGDHQGAWYFPVQKHCAEELFIILT